MFYGTVMLVVRVDVSEVVLRGGRVAETAFAAMHLATEDLFRQLSMLQIATYPTGPLLNLHGSCIRLPAQSANDWIQAQRIKDNRERSIAATAVEEALAKAGFGKDQMLPDSVFPEGELSNEK